MNKWKAEYSPQFIWLYGVLTNDDYLEDKGRMVLNEAGRKVVGRILESVYINGRADAVSEIQMSMFDINTDWMVSLDPNDD